MEEGRSRKEMGGRRREERGRRKERGEWRDARRWLLALGPCATTSGERVSHRVYRPTSLTVIPFLREMGNGKWERRRRRGRDGFTLKRVAGASEADWTMHEPGSRHHIRLCPRKGTTGLLPDRWPNKVFPIERRVNMIAA